MKWFTLKSSAMRERGESRSVYEAWVQGWNVASAAADQGIILPVRGSLHFRVTEDP